MSGEPKPSQVGRQPLETLGKFLPSKQSVVGSNPTGGVSYTNGSQHCWEPFFILRAQNGAQTVANGMSGSTNTSTGRSRFFT